MSIDPGLRGRLPNAIVSIRGFINASQAARLAGVKPATIIAWAEKGRIEGEKINGRWQIPAAQFERITLGT
ncbi:MAG: helix-turn-helix domain-containing protein [Hyphomicrobiaceae bacterium]